MTEATQAKRPGNRTGKRIDPGSGVRSAILWVGLALIYAVALSFIKDSMLTRTVQEVVDQLPARHRKVADLFQASYYFFYDDQFVPGIRQAISQPLSGPRLERIEFYADSGSLLFDSADTHLGKGDAAEKDLEAWVKEVRPGATTKAPAILVRGFNIRILVPGNQYEVVYFYDASRVRVSLLEALLAGLFAIGSLRWLWGRGRALGIVRQFRNRFVKVWGLRAKFFSTIALINIITSGIVFFTLSTLQTREQTRRIEHDSILFSEFSADDVVSDFTNYFYFYFQDKFLPGIKKIIASNENLVSIRIVSRRTRAVLFDSEQAISAVLANLGGRSALQAIQAGETAKSDFTPDIESELERRDIATRTVDRGGEKLLSVIKTYRDETQESLFWVEYLYSYQSLVQSVGAIRRQILVDLIPSLGLGLLIALVFAQLLISPIRRLVTALQRVGVGDYEVSVDVPKSDEIGELITAFNAMTYELRKKKELRKYLSDSTYRQIMAAPDTPGGLRLGGSRVQATVLFSDIRGFVAHCESLEAEEVTAMLNEYFSDMVDVVYKNGGEVDKFIGDALLAVFYAQDEPRTIRKPEAESTGQASGAATALQAIHCALEMRERLAEFNERRRARGKNTLEIGVGITYGEIISGPIGSKDRMDFTVIGDVVNLANRIEKLSKQGKHTKIVFSNHVEDKVRGLLEYEHLSHEKIRGKEEDVHVYELIGVKSLDQLLANLHSPDPQLRKRSVEVLGLSDHSEALEPAMDALQDQDEQVRVVAAAAVSKLAPRDDASALDALFAALTNEHAERVVPSMITAIGRVCGGERILELAPYLDSPNERIAANAIEAMAQARRPDCTDLILPKLSSRHNRVKANAAMALFAAGRFEVIDTLKPMLMHSDPLMRSSAAFAVGELTVIAARSELMRALREAPQSMKVFLAEVQECVPMLVSLLRDPETMVKRQAIVALGKIKDKAAVLPIIDILDQEKGSREMISEIGEALRAIGSHKLVREVVSRLSD